MALHEFVKRTQLPVPSEQAFAWHLRPGAFERLAPPWEDVRVISRQGEIEAGGRVEISVPMGFLRKRWVSEHCDFIPGTQFRDIQLSGPFAQWEHTHRVEPTDATSCFLEDRIQYRLPLGWLGEIGHAYVRAKLEAMFAYRHRVTLNDLTQHATGVRPMKILVTGSTGLVGSALIPFLTTGGHQVTRLVRSSKKAFSEPTITWNVDKGQLAPHALEGFDAVIHLAGEGIANCRWSAQQKQRIRDSRVQGTQLLCETLAKLKSPPKVLVSASAIGFYGIRGDEELTENSPAGSGFLSEVCQAWEQATLPAQQAGIRVVHARLGIILSPKGGALAKMLFPFRMGGGGILGSGKQYMSCVSLDDVLGVLLHCVTTDSLSGPVNVVDPRPVTNREFTKTLGRVLFRPTIFPVPAFAVRLLFGEMGDALLLGSTRVVPRKLLESGYRFRDPDLETCLRNMLNRTR